MHRFPGKCASCCGGERGMWLLNRGQEYSLRKQVDFLPCKMTICRSL